MKRIAIIPARGGSKRIPRKNIRNFHGKPMLYYAISKARNSGLFDKILVSSDDEEILKLAEKYDAETLDKRPKNISDDFTPTIPVIVHNIKLARTAGWSFEHVCCIYPCVPFMETLDLQLAFNKLVSCDTKFCFPVVKYSAPIQRALSIDENNRISQVYPEFAVTRTQDLKDSYYDAGQFYWGTATSWLESINLHSNSVGLVIPTWRAVDFDTPDDWERGEALFASSKIHT